MNRLTYKEIMSGYYPDTDVIDTDCFNKLGILEDVEEEISCPLDVVIKATREGIYATRRKWDGTKEIEVFEKFDATFDGYSLWNNDEYPITMMGYLKYHQYVMNLEYVITKKLGGYERISMNK